MPLAALGFRGMSEDDDVSQPASPAKESAPVAPAKTTSVVAATAMKPSPGPIAAKKKFWDVARNKAITQKLLVFCRLKSLSIRTDRTEGYKSTNLSAFRSGSLRVHADGTISCVVENTALRKSERDRLLQAAVVRRLSQEERESVETETLFNAHARNLTRAHVSNDEFVIEVDGVAYKGHALHVGTVLSFFRTMLELIKHTHVSSVQLQPTTLGTHGYSSIWIVRTEALQPFLTKMSDRLKYRHLIEKNEKTLALRRNSAVLSDEIKKGIAEARSQTQAIERMHLTSSGPDYHGNQNKPARRRNTVVVTETSWTGHTGGVLE